MNSWALFEEYYGNEIPDLREWEKKMSSANIWSNRVKHEADKGWTQKLLTGLLIGQTFITCKRDDSRTRLLSIELGESFIWRAKIYFKTRQDTKTESRKH